MAGEAAGKTLRERVLLRLAQVIDPETGVDVVRMRLIEDLSVEEETGVVRYRFRPSSPLCPLAVTLVLSIEQAVAEVEGVTRQEPEVVGYVGAEELNALLREELAAADVVIPTLDAADQETFRRINRPWPRFRIAEIVEGMARFREMFRGQLWMEVMLVRGLNDMEEVLFPLRDALRRIRPDRVQINVPVRPPAEPWVQVPDEEGLVRATAILGEAVEVVGPYEGTFDLSGADTLEEAVLSIIRRHPMRESRLLETLSRYAPGDVQATLAALEHGGQAVRRQYRGQVFWQYAGVLPHGKRRGRQ